MIFLLFVLLTVWLFWVAAAEEFDLISPNVWVVAGFLVCSMIGALNYNTWGDISFHTVILVLVSVGSFLVGGFFGNKLRVSHFDYGDRNIVHGEQFHINYIVVLIIDALMVFTAIEYYQFMYQNAIVGGSSGDVAHILSYARMGLAGENAIGMGVFLSVSLKFCFGFAHVQAYIVINDLVYRGLKSIRIVDLASIVLYLVHTVLSGGRTKMLYFVLFLTTVFIVLRNNKYNWTRSANKKTVRYLIVGVFVGLAIFWGIDKTLRGSVYGTEFTLWGQLSKYIGSSLYALNTWIENPTKMTTLESSETLYPLMSILNRFGGDYQFTNNALEFVEFGKEIKVSTNIYTAIRRYLHDYGYIGLVLFMFLEGVVYSHAYKRIKILRRQGLTIILYAILVYPVAFYFSEERFINDLFTLTMIAQLLSVVFIWKFAKLKVKI